jgi:hypothetical protein
VSKERECLLWVDAFLLGQKTIGSEGVAEIRRRVGNALRDDKWPPAWTEEVPVTLPLEGYYVADNYGPRDYGP